DEESWFDEPVWRPDGRSFFVATNEGRDTMAVKLYDLDAGRWSVLVESDWDLVCHGDEAGRWLLVHANEDGYSRLELRDGDGAVVVPDIPLPGRGVVEGPVFARDGSTLAFKFSSPVDPGDVWTYDVDRLRETLRASRRCTSPARLGSRPRVAPRLARHATADRCVARRSLRPLVRRLHGARRARVPARTLGGRDRMRGHLELRHVPRA